MPYFRIINSGKVIFQGLALYRSLDLDPLPPSDILNSVEHVFNSNLPTTKISHLLKVLPNKERFWTKIIYRWRLTWIIGRAELLVRAVTAVVIGVAPPGLEDASRVVALELVGLAAHAHVATVLLVGVVGAVEHAVADLGPGGSRYTSKLI